MLGWYARARRDLPWRLTREPYAILVSEVMLQQTQAARVAPRYAGFLARFPSARALAAAPVADVIRAWSGLGYNRRALALRAACAEVTRAGWPASAAELERLPGVGPYTAAAVASFAWDEPVAAVDTNVRRVIERWDGVRRGPAALRRRAAELVPPGRAADWNQALMELGATVCVARRPRCDACPALECASRGRPPAPAPRSRGTSVPFEATDRHLRGRVVAALAAGEPFPVEPDAARLSRVLGGLQRDGLVVLGSDGPRLP